METHLGPVRVGEADIIAAVTCCGVIGIYNFQTPGTPIVPDNKKVLPVRPSIHPLFSIPPVGPTIPARVRVPAAKLRLVAD
jgi:hypothetical protein